MERRTQFNIGYLLLALFAILILQQRLLAQDRIAEVSVSLGYTIQRPTEDRFLMTREELENKMAVLLGGRAAEEVVFGHLSTGAADDHRQGRLRKGDARRGRARRAQGFNKRGLRLRQRSAARSSASRASTQRAPSGRCSFFQKGARVFR